MKAVVCSELTGPDALTVVEREDPVAEEGQVVIDVESIGVNFPDLLMTRGMYQLKVPPPFSPGGELAGVISQVGAGVDGLAVGDRVLALTMFGGFVSKLAVGAHMVTKLPDSMDTRTAGAFAFTYATSYHALKNRARLSNSETLLVLGAAGGVGLAAVEIGAAMGARVIAAASTDEKLALCKAHGASEGINYRTEDLKKRAKQLGRADIVYDPVGGDYAEQALRALKPFGRHLVIGFAAGAIPKIPLNLTLLKECEIVGVAWGAWAFRDPQGHAQNIQELFAMHAAGALKPHISKAYPLAEAAQALHDMDARKVHGKVVLVPSS